MGELSATSQGLPVSITNISKIINSNHSLYLYCDLNENEICGFLKMGIVFFIIFYFFYFFKEKIIC
jgi:hypothetical protein